MNDWSPSRASTPAHWLMLDAALVVCDWIFDIAATSSFGPAP